MRYLAQEYAGRVLPRGAVQSIAVTALEDWIKYQTEMRWRVEAYRP